MFFWVSAAISWHLHISNQENYQDRDPANGLQEVLICLWLARMQVRGKQNTKWFGPWLDATGVGRRLHGGCCLRSTSSVPFKAKPSEGPDEAFAFSPVELDTQSGFSGFTLSATSPGSGQALRLNTPSHNQVQTTRTIKRVSHLRWFSVALLIRGEGVLPEPAPVDCVAAAALCPCDLAENESDASCMRSLASSVPSLSVRSLVLAVIGVDDDEVRFFRRQD